MHIKNLFKAFSAFLIFCLFFLVIQVNESKAQLIINEIQSSNIRSITDQNGEFGDWVELFNSGTTSLNLNGYGLSDDPDKPLLFQFPDMTIPAQSRILVFATDTNITDVNSHWETAVNSNSTWNYRANTTAPPDTNWRNLSFSSTWSSGTGGIGFGDSDDGTSVATCVSIYSRKTFSIPDISKIKGAILNIDFDDGFVAYLNGVEIARMNVGTTGIRPAWNALALAAHEAKMYSGGVPDSIYIDKALLMSILRNGTNVLALEVHNQTSTNNDLTCRPWLSFLVADEANYFGATPSFFKTPGKQYLHAAFKISRTGETIFLSNASGTIIDQKNSGILESDNSVGRNPDGSSTWCLFGTPSPDASNNSSSCASGYASSPVFSLGGGFYGTSQMLSLSSSFPGAQIRYTIDGSEVKSTSTLYTSAIRLDTSVTVRAAVFAANNLASPTQTNTYFIKVNTRLPVFSLTTDPSNLWDYNTGIFVLGPNAGSSNPYWGANFWQDWEKPITLEYFDRSKNRAFKFNSGMKITGGWSRSAPQKSLEIMLGDRYGQSKLNYSLEESVKPWLDKWDDFILHTTGNDRNLCKMRDPLMNRLLKGTNNDYLAYEPCMVFINGQNWGIYYIRENDDHHWIESNYGYKKDEVDLLKESYFYPGIEVKKGTDAAFFTMYEYAMNTSPSSPDFYTTMASYMDIENMVDYFIAETYYPNDDWMGGSNNNLKLWRPRKEGGKFRYLIYDLDFGFGYSGTVSNNMLATARNASPHNYNSDLFKVLSNNSTYKRYFINRYADLINTTFQPSNVEAMVNLFRDSLKYDMHFQWQAWGSDSANWVSKINSMLTFSSQRPAYARNFVQSEFGLTSQVTLTIQAQPAEAGRIQISTITPTTLPWTGVYFNGNPVTITAIPNPGYSFDHWRSNVVINQNNYDQSATLNFTNNDVITCYFTGSAAAVDIAFSEINYNSKSDSDAGDWIELKNSAAYTLNLSGWKFRDEDDHHIYEFPTGTTISPGAYLVLASDLTKFGNKFPAVQNVLGDFGFDFGNGGEDLRLFNHSDSLVASVYYQDQLPWPMEADGQGYTLERKDLYQSAANGTNWVAGCLGGSPGGPYLAPNVSVTASGLSTFCQGDSLSLQANASSGAIFQWMRNAQDISSANEGIYKLFSSGTYQVKVTANGCSALSDTVQVNVLPIEEIISTSSAQRCDTGSVQLSANSTSGLKWFDRATGGTELFSGSVFITPVLNQTTTYYVQASGACVGQRHPVNGIILPVNSLPQSQDVERCGPGTITLSASDSSSIRWYDSDSGGSLLATGSDLLISSLQQSGIYYVEAGNVCPSARLAVHANLIPLTLAPQVSNVSHCGPDAITLTVNDTTAIRWYDAVSGGTLLQTGNTYMTPVISQSTTYFVEAGDICPSVRVSVDAIINPVASDPLVTDVHRCGVGVVGLSAVAADSLFWYDAPGGTLLHSGNTYNTSSLNQTTIYFVQAGTACPSALVSIQAIIDSITDDPIINDVEHCGSGAVTLNANSGSDISWYDSPGGNLLNSGSSFNTPVLTQNAIYFARAGNICPSAYVPVQVTIHDLPLPDLGNDTIIASGTQLMLDPGQIYVSYLWSDGSTGSTLNVQTDGIYFVSVSDNHSCSASDSISVTVQLSTSIVSTKPVSDFIVYPNPASSIVYVQFEESDKSGMIQLIDVSGRVMRQQIIAKNELFLKMNTEGLASGLYQLQVIYTDELLNKTLVLH